jgi:hypothetical protein
MTVLIKRLPDTLRAAYWAVAMALAGIALAVGAGSAWIALNLGYLEQLGIPSPAALIFAVGNLVAAVVVLQGSAAMALSGAQARRELQQAIREAAVLRGEETTSATRSSNQS